MSLYSYKPSDHSSKYNKSSSSHRSDSYKPASTLQKIPPIAEARKKGSHQKSPLTDTKKTTSPWPSQGKDVSADKPPSASNMINSAAKGTGVFGTAAQIPVKFPRNIGGANVGGGAQSVIARKELKNVLSVTEQANPLVDSLKNTGELPPNYITKEVAEKSGFGPNRALNNHVPGGQIGGNIYKNRLFEKGALKKALKDGSWKETWKNRNTVLPWDSWKEADVGLTGSMRRSKQPGNRLLYSKSGEMYITTDHYDSFNHVGNYLDDGAKKAGNSVKGTSGVHPNLGKAAKVGGKALAVYGAATDVKELYDSYQSDGGKIGENTVTSAGGIAGSWGGAALGAKAGAIGGAALGSVIPFVGTAIGGIIGGLAGGIIGGIGGRWAGEKVAGAAYNEALSN